MKILIIGSGGRESALAWRLLQDRDVEQVIVCPGSEGMTRISDRLLCVAGKTLDDYFALAAKHEVDFTFVGPEGPLVAGLCDHFRKAGMNIVGPSGQAASLEGSKIFAKEFMKEFNIPTARFLVANSYQEAMSMIEQWPFSSRGYVIKADGLAGGKGVVVARSKEEASAALYSFMKDPDVAIKSPKILLEEVLVGREASFFALCDGQDYQLLGTACDHKRLLDGDEGPNTGGMGCFHDPAWPDQKARHAIEHHILQKTLKGMEERGTPYHGILFIGVMINDDNEPFVVEYNVRMGDPETQTLMPLLEGNFASLLYANASKGMGQCQHHVTLANKSSVHVVMTSKGYPSIGKHPVDQGRVINDERDLTRDHSFLFFAGVKKGEQDKLVTAGGRVLGVTGVGQSIAQARSEVYQALKDITFEGSHFRRDIGLWRE